MKAMILAAGRGERMRPLTDTTPKPLLQIAGKSLLEYHIEALVQAGITELVINHAWLGEKIEHYLGDGSRYGATIHYSRESEALETAGGIKNALPLLGDQPFIVVNGDIFTDYPFAQLKISAAKLSSAVQAHLVLVNNPQHHPQGDFYCRNELLFDRQQSPKSDELAWTFSGIACYAPAFFAGMAIAKQALAPMLRFAMAKQQVSGEIYHGDWWDIGTPQRLQELNHRSPQYGAGNHP